MKRAQQTQLTEKSSVLVLTTLKVNSSAEEAMQSRLFMNPENARENKSTLSAEIDPQTGEIILKANKNAKFIEINSQQKDLEASQLKTYIHEHKKNAQQKVKISHKENSDHLLVQNDGEKQSFLKIKIIKSSQDHNKVKIRYTRYTKS